MIKTKQELIIEDKEIEKEIEKILPSNCDAIFFKYATSKNIKTRNEIANKNKALVTFIINKYYSSKKEHKNIREDLIQEGIIGLLSAIDGFKPELGYRFSTYSSWWIRQAINNYLLNIEPIIHIPNHIRTANNKLSKKLKEENITLQSFIDNHNTTEYSNKMLHSIECANKVKYVSSIDEKIKQSCNSDGETKYIKDILPAPNCLQSDNVLDNTNMIQIVKTALNKLSDRERYILLLRFDVLNKIPKHQKIR